MRKSIIIHIMQINLSLAQMSIVSGDMAANSTRALEMIITAAQRGSTLVLLPELWSSGYDLANGARHADANLDLIKQLSVVSREQNITIGGSYLLEQPGGIENTFVLLTPDDNNPPRYSKIHLFRLMDEEKWLHPGSTPVCFPASWGQTGLAICYDLRFPELFRSYALSDALITLVVAEWAAQRSDHWKVLLQARAIENQMFLAAVNCVGPSGSKTFGGASAVISPWGETIIQGSQTQDELLTVSIDLDTVQDVRQRIPVFADRRPDVYNT